MLRSDGLQPCIRTDLVLTHQFVTALATIKERQTSSWAMSLIVSAVASLGLTNADVSVRLGSYHAENTNGGLHARLG